MTDKEKTLFLKNTDRDELGFNEDCSQIIDVIQQIAGSEHYIKSFKVEYNPGINCKDIGKSKKKFEAAYDPNKSHVIFKNSDRRAADISSGHFLFYNKDIKQCQDSYSLGWQSKGSNGFCQTFALMGALGMSYQFNKLSKEKCSETACRFLITHVVKNRVFFKSWKKICKNKNYSNIINMNPDEVTEDLEKSMKWTLKRGKTTIFWKLITDETIYY